MHRLLLYLFATGLGMLTSTPAGAHGDDEASATALTAAWQRWLLSDEGRKVAGEVKALPRELWRALPTVLPDRELALTLAKGAWQCLDSLRDARSGLPLDRFDLISGADVKRRTSLDNLGLYLACVLAARELGFLGDDDARARLDEALDALEALEGDGGNPFEWFSTETLKAEHRRVSAVALGWLASGLMVAQRACRDEALAKRCAKALQSLDFTVLYDPGPGLFRGHLDLDPTRQLSSYHNGCYASETRIISYCAIALGQVPPSHLFRPWRIPPWQRDETKGAYHTYLGIPVWEQTVQVPGGRLGAKSWGGALFETLMPTLMVDEGRLMPRSLGVNDRATLAVHVTYAARTGAPVWGWSPCAVPGMKAGYGVFGVSDAGASDRYGTDVVTPHASALALAVNPVSALRNLRRMLALFPALAGPYGPYDAVSLKTGEVARAYLALDESMILLSAANYLRDGCIQRAFEAHPGVRERLLPILGLEEFLP